MNKKGFTLIELIAVITLLGIIGVIAYTSVTGISRSIQENMLEKKVEMIEEAAKQYGQDVKGSVINSTKKYSGNKCISIIVSDLVPDYLDSDNENTCLTASSVSSNGCIVDPSNNSKYLDKSKVIVYYKNKRIYAKVDLKNNLTCR